jgi:uncharacterized protein YjbI with pentapeptide repeats
MKQLKNLWTQLQSTEQLLKNLKTASNDDALAILETLKERLLHQDGNLKHLDLSGVKLNKATLAAAVLEGIDFSHASLEHCYFFDAKLSGANFSRAKMTFANFRGARLSTTNFAEAELSNVNFARADLSGANLSNASLVGANFWRTNLSGANLDGANLVDASMIDVLADETTLLPDGSPYSSTTDWRRFTGQQ